MRNLLSLLERFSRSLNKDSWIKDIVAEAILDKTRVRLPPESISLKGGVLEISTFASAKNEISLKEEEIRHELKTKHNISFSRILYR
jgi:hypothetical protein